MTFKIVESGTGECTMYLDGEMCFMGTHEECVDMQKLFMDAEPEMEELEAKISEEFTAEETEEIMAYIACGSSVDDAIQRMFL